MQLFDLSKKLKTLSIRFLIITILLFVFTMIGIYIFQMYNYATVVCWTLFIIGFFLTIGTSIVRGIIEIKNK